MKKTIILSLMSVALTVQAQQLATPVASASANITPNGTVSTMQIPSMPGSLGGVITAPMQVGTCSPNYLTQWNLVPAPQPYSIPAFQSWSQNQAYYGQIWARCVNEITTLNMARADAMRIQRLQGHNAAADYLIAALERIYQNINVEIGERLPHTYQAVIASYTLAKTVQTVVNGQNLDLFLKGRIKFNAVNKAIDAIIFAYNQLDNPYYMTRVNTCAGGLGTCATLPLPEVYFSNLTSLSGQYVNLFLSMAVDGNGQFGNWSSDVVELVVGKVIAQIGRNLINSSENRRYLACVAFELYQIERMIDIVLSTCSPDYLIAQDVEMIRARFVAVGNFMGSTMGVPAPVCHVIGW